MNSYAETDKCLKNPDFLTQHGFLNTTKTKGPFPSTTMNNYYAVMKANSYIDDGKDTKNANSSEKKKKSLSEMIAAALTVPTSPPLENEDKGDNDTSDENETTVSSMEKGSFILPLTSFAHEEDWASLASSVTNPDELTKAACRANLVRVYNTASRLRSNDSKTTLGSIVTPDNSIIKVEHSISAVSDNPDNREKFEDKAQAVPSKSKGGVISVSESDSEIVRRAVLHGKDLFRMSRINDRQKALVRRTPSVQESKKAKSILNIDTSSYDYSKIGNPTEGCFISKQKSTAKEEDSTTTASSSTKSNDPASMNSVTITKTGPQNHSVKQCENSPAVMTGQHDVSAKTNDESFEMADCYPAGNPIAFGGVKEGIADSIRNYGGIAQCQTDSGNQVHSMTSHESIVSGDIHRSMQGDLQPLAVQNDISVKSDSSNRSIASIALQEVLPNAGNSLRMKSSTHSKKAKFFSEVGIQTSATLSSCHNSSSTERNFKKSPDSEALMNFDQCDPSTEIVNLAKSSSTAMGNIRSTIQSIAHARSSITPTSEKAKRTMNQSLSCDQSDKENNLNPSIRSMSPSLNIAYPRTSAAMAENKDESRSKDVELDEENISCTSKKSFEQSNKGKDVHDLYYSTKMNSSISANTSVCSNSNFKQSLVSTAAVDSDVSTAVSTQTGEESAPRSSTHSADLTECTKKMSNRGLTPESTGKSNSKTILGKSFSFSMPTKETSIIHSIRSMSPSFQLSSFSVNSKRTTTYDVQFKDARESINSSIAKELSTADRVNAQPSAEKKKSLPPRVPVSTKTKKNEGIVTAVLEEKVTKRNDIQIVDTGSDSVEVVSTCVSSESNTLNVPLVTSENDSVPTSILVNVSCNKSAINKNNKRNFELETSVQSNKNGLTEVVDSESMVKKDETSTEKLLDCYIDKKETLQSSHPCVIEKSSSNGRNHCNLKHFSVLPVQNSIEMEEQNNTSLAENNLNNNSSMPSSYQPAPVTQINFDPHAMDDNDTTISLPIELKSYNLNVWNDDSSYQIERDDEGFNCSIVEQSLPILYEHPNFPDLGFGECMRDIEDLSLTVTDAETFGEGRIRHNVTDQQNPYVCGIDIAELKQEIATEMKASASEVFTGMTATLRKMFGVCDITSNGGADILANNVSLTQKQLVDRRRHQNKKLTNKTIKKQVNSEPKQALRYGNPNEDTDANTRFVIKKPFIIQNEIQSPISSEKVAFSKLDSNIKISLVEKQAQAQFLKEKEDEMRKKKYLKKLKALSSKHF